MVALGQRRFRMVSSQRDPPRGSIAETLTDILPPTPAAQSPVFASRVAVKFRPGKLHRVVRVLGEPFDGHDFLIGANGADRINAAANRAAVDVDGAGAALRDSAAILRPGQSELFT